MGLPSLTPKKAVGRAAPRKLRAGTRSVTFAAADTDFFADRVTDSSAQPRLVLVGDDEPYGGHAESKWDNLGDEAGRRAAGALAGLAASRGIGCSRVEVPEAPPLVRFAAASATGEFAATYLALARGIDPSAPRLGELPH